MLPGAPNNESRTMHHLLSWTDSAAKTAAGFSVWAWVSGSPDLAGVSAAAAILATLIPHAIKAYRDMRAAKRTEDTADHDRRDLEQAIRDRVRLDERTKILEEELVKLREALEAARCPFPKEGAARCNPHEAPGSWLKQDGHQD